MTHGPAETQRRKAILRDWRDGYSLAGSARLRKCSVGFVRRVRDEERRRRLKLARERRRRRLAMHGVVAR